MPAGSFTLQYCWSRQEWKADGRFEGWPPQRRDQSETIANSTLEQDPFARANPFHPVANPGRPQPSSRCPRQHQLVRERNGQYHEDPSEDYVTEEMPPLRHAHQPCGEAT
jgi:hypothetical protein